ncbi:heme NO-binding domain-containing protein [Clostridium sp. C8-1-8]|uniref:heme NO-binding domain-containing protein n=1 Tax=Clostridium sp. C8-1-8 TaxID=2698831 RepID=UPI00136C557D|nr:heme NO-binding domain-containing protein [Clostridium sp. C8-1-8]
MKGTVVSTWLKTCRRLYGDDVVDSAMTKVSWDSNKIFTPLENVDDKVIGNVIRYIAEVRQMEIGRLWHILGENNIDTFYNDYPAFFRKLNLYTFLKAMNDVHAVIMRKFAGAKPPAFQLEPVSKNQAIFVYNSPRGMFDYFQGLLIGSAKRFGEEITIEEVARTETSLSLKLTFQYEIINRKKFRINKILSLGFIRNIGIKSAIPTFVVTAILGVILAGTINGLILAGVASVISALFTSIMLSPRKVIINELNAMAERKYSNFQLESKDMFEDIFNSIVGVKNMWSQDLTSFNSVTDEMNVFSKNMFDITESMKFTTDEISGFSGQVADMATEQDINTEKLVTQINNNIEEINSLVSSENKNKAELDKAVLKIGDSYEHVEKSSRNIEESLKSFMGVKDSGRRLQEKALDITSIVSIVSGISEQTNLLALNASIEAARAGEQGRGFAVVAESIRKLAEQSKDAVGEINSNLDTFAKDINVLVDNIDDQYKILETETSSLRDVKDISFEAKNSIQEVSQAINTSIEALNREADSIQEMFKSIDSLAAIAVENAAASETVSASIDDYKKEIDKTIESIRKIEGIIDVFKKELAKYNI